MSHFPLLIHNVGLGDCILQAGGVVELAKRHGGLRFPCFYRRSLAEIFKDVPEVELVELVQHPEEMLELPGPYIMSGVHPHRGAALSRPNRPIDVMFYEEVGVPLYKKWESFPWIPDGKGLQPPAEPYIFVHDDASRGFVINKLNGWTQDQMQTTGQGPVPYLITDFARVMMEAAEIHVINSAFMHLAEALPLRPEQPKYLHRYSRGWGIWDMPTFRPEQNWVILD